MNNINEIKEMLDKLNEELESLRSENEELKRLRVENAELKLRLAKYETVETATKLDCQRYVSIDEMFNSEFYLKNQGIRQILVRAYNVLKRNFSDDYSSPKLTLANLCLTRQAGYATIAVIIVVLEHYGIILKDDMEKYPTSKHMISKLNTSVDKMRKTILF